MIWLVFGFSFGLGKLGLSIYDTIHRTEELCAMLLDGIVYCIALSRKTR